MDPRSEEMRATEMLAVNDELRRRAAKLIANVEPTPSALRRIRDGVVFRIRRAMVCADEPQFVDYDLVRSVLIPMFGPALAETAMVRAGESHARPFARNLGNIIDVICGSTAAKLVEQSAQPVSSDRIS